MLVVLLFFVAFVGHAVLVFRSHNWWYGTALGRTTIDMLQFQHAVILFGGPALFVWGFGFDVRPLFEERDAGRLLLAVYVVLCWFAAVVMLPLVTVARHCRRCPALVSTTSTVVDVEAELGQPLHGDGKHAWLARLPGNQVRTLELTVKTLRLPHLPSAWDGLSILHLSDFHFYGSPARAYFEKVLEQAAAWKPDVVALTGDYVDGPAYHGWLEILERLAPGAVRLAILGNHDQWYEPERIRARLKEMGYRVVVNGWEVVEIRSQPMVVIGTEYPWERPAPDLSGCCNDIFRLCLSHTPDNIRWAQRHKIDLMLSGHVHGGQIRLPVIGSVVVPSLYGRRYDCGVFQEGGMLLHVSRGLSGKHPLRYGCRPEATLLVLRPTQFSSPLPPGEG